jgi:hypothetical protein
VTSQTLSSEIDLFEDRKLSAETKESIRQEVGQFLVEQINLHLAKTQSPVDGGTFKALSPKYKKEKQSDGLAGRPDLEFSGQMKDQIDFRSTSKGIEIGVFGSAAARADGHNNFSGQSQIPTRQFLPKEGETFKSSIDREINKIINDKIAEDIDLTRADVAEIGTKEELFEVLRDIFPNFSRKEIIDAVIRNDEMLTLLNEFNLVRFLNG